MIQIKPIERYQVADIKRMILSVARSLYHWEASLDELITHFDERSEFSDVDDFVSHYLNQQGLFLVVTDDHQVIDSGAVRRIDPSLSELKRLWLLEKYQGLGIGYPVLQALIDFARSQGYSKICLETDHEQERAIQFYKQVGFQETESYNDRNSNIYMALEI
jgi:putative acetyltransferase